MNIGLQTLKPGNPSNRQVATINCQNTRYTNSKPYVIEITEPEQDEPRINISCDHTTVIKDKSLKLLIELLQAISSRDVIKNLEENIYVLPFASEDIKEFISNIKTLSNIMGLIKE